MSVNGQKVKFVLVNGALPTDIDPSTIYFDQPNGVLYVGSEKIADTTDYNRIEQDIADATSDAVSVVVTGTGNYITDATFDDATHTLTVTKGTLPEYSIEETTASADAFKTYQLTKDGTATGTKIDIPKDLVLKEGALKRVEAANTPYVGAVVGDYYLELVLNDDAGTKINIPLKELTDVYLAGTGLSFDADTRTFSVDTNTIATVTSVNEAKAEAIEESKPVWTVISPADE